MRDYLLAQEDSVRAFIQAENAYYSEPEYDEVIQECRFCEEEMDGWRIYADTWECLTCREEQPLTR